MSRNNLFIITALALCLLSLFSFSNASAQQPLAPELRNSIRGVRIADSQRLLSLTFDLCEGPRETAGFDSELVDYLSESAVRVTFFAGGKWMRSHPEETMRLMSDPLFEIGSHSWDHANFAHLSESEAREQIVRTNDEYALIRDALAAKLGPGGQNRMAAIPPSLHLLRFPYGTCTASSLAMLADFGMPAIQWSIVSGDPARDRTAAGIISTVASRIRPGAIIVFHANGKGHGTLGALRVLVPELRKEGWQFMTVSELLTAGEPVSSPECYELKPGDTARYNRLGRRNKSAATRQDD